MLILAYLHCRTADRDPNSGMYIHQKSEYGSNWEDKSGLGSELKSMLCKHGLCSTIWPYGFGSESESVPESVSSNVKPLV